MVQIKSMLMKQFKVMVCHLANLKHLVIRLDLLLETATYQRDVFNNLVQVQFHLIDLE